MKWIVGGLALTLTVSACGPSEPRANAAPERAIATSPIQKCMNLGNALDSPEREGEWGYTIRRQDMVRLRADGFDTVRIPIRWSTRAGTRAPYTIDPDFLARVDEVV
ncbi:MAG: cellulase family glycosylhydrolase, partial [Pseudomonadota bacterium]